MTTSPVKAWYGGSRGGGLGHRFFVKLASSRLGRTVAPFFVFWVVIYFLLAWPTARRASGRFADRVGLGGSHLRRLHFTFRHFTSYGSMLFDRVVFLGGGVDLFTCELPDWELVRDSLAKGQGVIVVSAHQGNWEAMSQSLARKDIPLTIVMHDGIPPEARAALESTNAGRSFRVLFADGTPASVAAILSDLREGRVVGIMGDRLLGSRGSPVPFLGGLARFPLGPYALSSASGAPVLHALAERVGPRHYVFHCHAEPANCQPGIQGGRVPPALRAAAFAARLDELVRRRPEQWGNFFDLWEDPAA